MQYPQGKILVFCKAPESGKVKTRLQSVLSPAQCAQLHTALARQALLTVTGSGLAGVELWCAGDTGHPFLKECARRYGIEIKQQQGGDLGMRMAQALQTTLHSSAFAIIIGTDCPGLDKTHLQTAAAFLADGEPGATRVMIGPAADGGYVLFGANGPVSGAFENIDWGGAEVLQQTRQRLRSLEVTWQELEPLADIDRPEDLKHLPTSLASELAILPQRDP